MKNKKIEFLICGTYVVLTFLCIILGCVLKDIREAVFTAWYFLSAIIWFALWVKVAGFMRRRNRRK